MKDTYLLKWLIRAEHDFKSAKALMKSQEELLTDSICFHCQQSVEKFLKAFLVHNKVNIEKTHNIEALLKRCSNIDLEFIKIEPGLLSYYAVDVRYPDDFFTPTEDDTKKALSVAGEIRKTVLQKLNVNENELKIPK